MNKAHLDYKSLSASEQNAYAEIAETMCKENRKKMFDFKPSKISVYAVMKKDRAAKLPKEKRTEYVFKKASEDYKNLTSEERMEYEAMAKECDKKKMKVYKIRLQSQPKS